MTLCQRTSQSIVPSLTFFQLSIVPLWTWAALPSLASTSLIWQPNLMLQHIALPAALQITSHMAGPIRVRSASRCRPVVALQASTLAPAVPLT